MLLGCQGQKIEHSSDIVTLVTFQDGITIHEALGLFEKEDPLPSSSIRIVYDDHESEIDVVGATPEETADTVIETELDRLSFLVTQFNAEKSRESDIYFALLDDHDFVKNEDTLLVSRLNVEGAVIIKNSDIVESVEVLTRFVQENGDTSASPKSIKDWTGDAGYVPEGGTSSIYTSGTLQKFWMDEESADYFNAASDGIEIDTLVDPRSASKCGSSASSNMPNAYKDTEAFDWYGSSSKYRNCSVGTMTADELVEDTLYWTWHTFKNFSSSSNPKLHVMFQPSTWGGYVISESDCLSWGAWCMFSRSDMPSEYLVSYNYNDAPGVETSWVKN